MNTFVSPTIAFRQLETSRLRRFIALVLIALVLVLGGKVIVNDLEKLIPEQSQTIVVFKEKIIF